MKIIKRITSSYHKVGDFYKKHLSDDEIRTLKLNLVGITIGSFLAFIIL